LGTSKDEFGEAKRKGTENESRKRKKR